MKSLNRILLAGMMMALTSCASHPKSPPAPMYHQWNVSYLPALLQNSGAKVNFYLDFNDELGMLRVTVAGAQELFGKGNIGTRWHEANGDILDPTQSAMDTPGTVTGGGVTNWFGVAQFSKQSHVLEAGWMEVMIGQDWFWLEVPTGVTMHPGTPPATSQPQSNVRLPTGVGQMTAKDHIMRWNDLTCNNLRMTKAGPGRYWTNQLPAAGTFH